MSKSRRRTPLDSTLGVPVFAPRELPITEEAPPVIALCRRHLLPAVEAREAHASHVSISIDLGITRTSVEIDEQGVHLPNGMLVTWKQVEEIFGDDTGCFAPDEGGWRKIVTFAPESGKVYALYATHGAPTMMLSGIPMHRFKAVDPWQDTLLKMRTLTPVTGNVLDICTGLGYTAIAASRTASTVTTVELSDGALSMCRANPWSRELFTNENIQRVTADAVEWISGASDESFSRIFHDPPTLSIAGELYSRSFYVQLYRCLRRGGAMYHYIGNLESSTGKVTARGVMQRLRDAGFRVVEPRPEAFGLLARK